MQQPTETWAVEVLVSSAEVDLVSGLLWGCGISALSEQEQPDGSVVLLRVDMPAEGRAAIDATLGEAWTAHTVLIADTGLDGWRDHAAIARAGRSLVVRPTWIPYEPGPGEVVVDIDPGHSFGHGAHPTTRLCLALIERLVVPGSSVLDVGCGSGVLAIAAAKLGADRVVGVDTDPAALAATRANISVNQVTMTVSHDTLDEVDGRFDLLVANIGAATLSSLAPALVSLAEPGGVLILSGLLEDRFEVTLDDFSGWTSEVHRDSGWVAALLRHA